MADPITYNVTFDFSGFQASNPAAPLPASPLDVEFANIETAINSTNEALAEIRRSDGALQNGVVTIDALAEEVADRFEGSSAYRIAVENGFVGTEAEWLESLEGEDGSDGAAATIAIGTVTTLAPNLPATVVNVGTPNAAILDIGIPKGNTGASGAGTGDMLAATYDPTGKAADAFSQDNMADGAVNKNFTATEKTKLAGVATGATANDTDVNLKARSNHTGTQAQSTVDNLVTDLAGKQPLATVLTNTTAAFTTEQESKLALIEAGATANDTDQVLKTEYLMVAVSDETTPITAGLAKVRFRMPVGLTGTAVRATLNDPQTSGSIVTVDINIGGATVLSTKLTIDNNEETSTTAATPAVISNTAWADDAEVQIDIDQVGNGTAKGLKVTLIGYRA